MTIQQLSEFVTNHWELFLALAVIAAFLLKDVVAHPLQGVKALGPLEATQIINHNNAVVLDVREEQEFAGGHILNAIHVPLKSIKDQPKALTKHKKKPIIVGCRSGNRSVQACKELRKQGFENVYTLKGGVLAWQNANLPINKAKTAKT